MIKKNLKTLIITSIITLLPILAGIILWNQLPDKLPVHWDISGNIDGYASKAFVVFALPFIFTALNWICSFTTLADPKKQNHSGKVLSLVFWLVPLISVVLFGVIYAASLGKKVLITIVLPVMLGFIFVIIGNYLPKCKQNYTVGIKTPWTLNSEEIWNKTHRLAGWLWVAGGIAIMVFGFFKIVWAVLPIVLVISLIPLIYSYVLHKKASKRNDGDNDDA